MVQHMFVVFYEGMKLTHQEYEQVISTKDFFFFERKNPAKRCTLGGVRTRNMVDGPSQREHPFLYSFRSARHAIKSFRIKARSNAEATSQRQR